MTFAELDVGQEFRMLRDNHRQREWRKIEPEYLPTGRLRYNAIALDGEDKKKIGPTTKVITPPYKQASQTEARKPKKRYQRFNDILAAAGWRNRSEFEIAVVNGEIEVPKNPH